VNHKFPDHIPEFIQEAIQANTDLSEGSPHRIERVLASIGAASGQCAPAPALKGRLIAAVSAGTLRYAPFFGKICGLFDVDRAAVLRLFERSESDTEWQPGPHPSIQLLHLEGGAAVTRADVGLVKMPAGFGWPSHRHLGEERVLILEGGYDDDAGNTYRAGDIHEMAAGTVHSFAVHADKPLLMAVVLFNGIEMV
jgi:quercetin dioxygenase-like cupin family protein